MEFTAIDVIGLVGSLFILAAWLYETYETKKKGERLNKKFILIYIIGLVPITYYSYMINSTPFMLLNGVILVITVVELLLNLKR